VEEDMTEFLGTDGGQIADQVTGLTAAAEQVVAARPELVWDLVADITRVGGWSPECIRAAWLTEPGPPQPGARFTGHNRFLNGLEYEVTCVVTEADRPCAFGWAVLDDSGDPRPPVLVVAVPDRPAPRRRQQGPAALHPRTRCQLLAGSRREGAGPGC
jgi:hypothetical protein